jgi:hypothetical protein
MTTRTPPCCKPANRSRRRQSELPEANAGGSTTIYIGPTLPARIKAATGFRAVPDEGYFVCLRLYRPLEPFFNKSWRPSEIDLVK